RLALFPDPAGGHEEGAGEPMLLKHRHGLAVEVAISVVKSQHNGPFRQFSDAVGEKRGEGSRGDRVEAGVVQVGELVSEYVRGDREPAGGRRSVSYLVIHQDGNPKRRNRGHVAKPPSGKSICSWMMRPER